MSGLRGLFVTFEGPDGAGKSTQAEMLSAALVHLHPVVVREPGGTETGEQIRDLLLHSAVALAPQTEMYLFLAARAELVANVIAPSLAADRLVIADRYHDSTLAYQGGARGLDVDWPTFLPRPDVTFLLALTAEEALERRALVAAKADRVEAEDLDFHRAVANAYDRLAMAEPARFVRIDARAPAEEIHERVMERVQEKLREREAATERDLPGVVRSS